MTQGNEREFPPILERKLVAAKDWQDKRRELIESDFADAKAWTDNCAEGVLLLDEIVEIVDNTLGWGLKLTRKSTGS